MSPGVPLPNPNDNEVRSFHNGDVPIDGLDRLTETAAESETVCVRSVVVEHGGPDDPGDPTHRPLAAALWEQIRRCQPQT
jgi:hypothetical protein